MAPITTSISTSDRISVDKIDESMDRVNKDTNDGLTDPVDPPFPWTKMNWLMVGMLAHSTVFTNPMPFVAFMVVDFKMSPSLDSAGYFAGYITGAFMIGRAISGIPWGFIADRWGRKPCLLISMFNVTVFGILFGFSTNFTMAVLARLAIGLGNGYMGAAKVCVTELVQTKSHEMRGFGLMNGIWGLGLIVGPAVGGILSRPAVQYPHIFAADSIWGQFPYLLPCLICSAIAMAAFFGVLFTMEETLIKPNKPKTQIMSSHSSQATSSRIIKLGKSFFRGRNSVRYDELPGSSTHGFTDDESDDSNTTSEIELRDLKQISRVPAIHLSLQRVNQQIDDEPSIKLKQLENGNKVASQYDNYGIEAPDEESKMHPTSSSTYKSLKDTKPSSWKEIIVDSYIRVLFKAFLCFCFIITFVDESLPLWTVTTLSEGGLEFSAAETGAMLASVGLGLVVFQLFLYERMMKLSFFTKYPGDVLYKLALMGGTGLAFIPVCSTVSVTITEAYKHSLSENVRKIIIHVSVLMAQLLYRCSGTSAFSILSIVVNGSVEREMRGTINGVIMTFQSLGNATGPIVGSTIYALLIDAPKPLDGRYIFVIASVLMLTYGFICKKYFITRETL